MTTTIERLRADIDGGRARDKVHGHDPAAAPLGADEEAAGTPLSPESIARAHRTEIDSAPASEEDGGAGFYVSVIAGILLILAVTAALALR